MTDATAPLVSPEVDLRDFSFMPLDVVRLRDSGLTAKATGDEFRAAVLLWCASWHQRPAASLPDDDQELANLCGYGRAPKEWKKVRQGALHGFVKCSDGRLYHPLVAEKAADAWASKQAQRARTEAARRAREEARQRQLQDKPQSLSQTQKISVTEVVTESKGQGQGQGQGIKSSLPSVENAGLRPAGDGDPADRPALVLVPPTTELPDCPHQELLALYRKHLPHLRQPMRWDGERAEAMRTRWRECAQPTPFGDGYRTRDEGLAFWDRFFAYVAKVPKLANGITSREGGQERIWKPDLAWLVIRGNFTKVIEGAYA